MNTTEQQQLNLEECNREEIQRTGAIRPSGCLMALGIDDLTVRYVSENITRLLGSDARTLLGKPLSTLVSAPVVERLRKDIAVLPQGRRFKRRYPWPGAARTRTTIVHFIPQDRLVVLEVSFTDDSVEEVHERLHQTLDFAALEEQADIGHLMKMIAEGIRTFTEYDRVMVYRFAPDGSGYVAAEDVRPDLPSFLGLHYPGSDIPPAARRLFVRNRVRLIEDVNYEPVPILGHDAAPNTLDLSGALMRSVSPIHIRYLTNMGVKGSLAISLVRDGQLWGMVACHHYSPRHLPSEVLTATELISQLLSVLCQRAERVDLAAHASRCNRRIELILDAISEHPDGVAAATRSQLGAIAEAVNAQGVALVDGSRTDQQGETPPPEALQDLGAWLRQESKNAVFTTTELGSVWPGAQQHGLTQPGLMAIPWTQDGRSWLLIFRSEQVHQVTWAGNPTKALVRDDDGRLSPRGSFAAWKDEVRGVASPWSSAEIDALRPIRRLATLRSISDAANAKLQTNGAFPGSTNDPILIVDLQGQIVEWNSAVESRLGVQRAQGQQITSLLDFASDAHMPDLLRQAASGEVWIGEHERPGSEPGDPPAFFEIALMPVATGDHEVTNVAVALRDVTERKLLEEQLLQAQKMEALGQLTGGLAHNFNNVLTVILGTSDMVLAQLKPENPVRPDIELIRATCEDAAKIVRDLMAFARQERTAIQKVDICACIKLLAGLIKRTLLAQIRIELDVPARPHWVMIDQQQIEQVVMNLAINARDAITPPGKISIRVFTNHLSADSARIHDLPGGNYVTVEVADTGAGVPQEIIDRIFEPFFTTKSNQGGTGLGLSSSFGIISKHGGRLAVRSNPGRGSTFSIILPAAEVETERPAPSHAESAQDMLTILLVDDEPAMRSMLTRLLGQRGCEVLTAENGAAALELLNGDRASDIDILVSDQRMPGMTGTDLVMQARQHAPDLPVILMSGHSLDDWPEDAHNQRMIQKPFRPDELVELIQDLVKT